MPRPVGAGMNYIEPLAIGCSIGQSLDVFLCAGVFCLCILEIFHGYYSVLCLPPGGVSVY